MNILDIYQKYRTPPNLQEHQLLVTRIALQIVSNWSGPDIDINSLKIAALLHDLANIVKFDFDKHPEFLGEEQLRIEFWREQQKQIVEKYGNDDHVATSKMLREIGISPKVFSIIDSKSVGNAIEVDNSSAWESKILIYSDLRVGPFGIVSLKDRTDDITVRLEKYKNRPDLPQFVAACQHIEQKIQSLSKLNLATLSVNDLSYSDAELLNTKL